MPRRHRPPASAREIGAYLCGVRLRRLWAEHEPGDKGFFYPTDDQLVHRLAEEDAVVMASMDEADWWAHFWTGWDEAFR